MEDSNRFGEALRNYCFIPDECGGTTGCYSTFKLRPEFKPIKKDSKKWKKLFNLIVGECDKEYIAEVRDRIKMFSDGNIHLAWYWDGDGSILIVEGDKGVINTDAKCDYTWEWV